jgi:hypothetical protein
MLPKKIFRSSGCLVVAGTVLLVASLTALALGIVIGLVGPKATRDAVANHDRQTMTKALTDLRKIPNLPPAVAKELESNGKVSDETLSQLPTDQRQRVLSVLIDYHGGRAGSGLAHGVTAGVGTLFVLVLLAFGVPGSIVGLLLVRRRKVWRCGQCGFAFDRT